MSSTPHSAQALGEKYANDLRISQSWITDPIFKFTAKLNLDALRTAAGEVMNSECTNVYHIATGGYNAVYILTFLDGREAIARLNSEYQKSDQILLRDSVLSEAATLRYVRENCKIPVPDVYGVNHVSPNPVGARYILEERILGHPWTYRECTTVQLTELFAQIFKFQAEFIRTRFDAIGSIYHNSETDSFYVGPMGPSVSLSLDHTVDRGPWSSTRGWLKAYVKSELAIIRDDPEGYRKRRLQYGLDGGNAPFGYHVAWLETLLSVMDKLQYLNNIPGSAERPVLQHDDLNDGNILISYDNPTLIAGLIDFEGARVVPMWSATKEPYYPLGTDEETLATWREMRNEIFMQADPAWPEVEKHVQPLRRLWRLVSLHFTIRSIEALCQTYEEMKEDWPIDEPAFADLDRVIALGPAGYGESGPT